MLSRLSEGAVGGGRRASNSRRPDLAIFDWVPLPDPPVNKRELSTRENGETALFGAYWARFAVAPQTCQFQPENLESDNELAECCG